MSKKFKDIVKNGIDTINPPKIDFADPSIIKQIEECHKRQEEILARKEINPETMNFVINI